MAGGDVLMDRSEPAGVDVFAGIAPLLEPADLAMVNVEMAIADIGEPVPGKEFVFRAPPSAASRFGAAGIDVVSLANNHARDFGADALVRTRELLEDAGVRVVGAGRDIEEAFAVATMEIGETTVGVVAASLIVPGGFAAGDRRPGIANGHERQRLLDTVSAAASTHDVVIVTIHWGIEREVCATAAQVEVADELLRAGATAVIGHHPHVLEPIRFDQGRAVVFSLGNFVWHPRAEVTGETGVVELVFDGPTLTTVDFHPHVLDGDGAPVPAPPGSRRDRILDTVWSHCGL